METLPRLMPYIKGRTADGVTPDDVRVHLSEMLAGSIPAAATIRWRERDAARRGKVVKTAPVNF